MKSRYYNIFNISFSKLLYIEIHHIPGVQSFDDYYYTNLAIDYTYN